MKEKGVPWESDVMKPDSTTVFSFPQKAPKDAVVRDDIDAIKHLELWAVYQEAWCEHKPSVTINVREEEWMKVGAWVYDHFDEMSGVSFLPHDGGSYRQAPYEEITKDLYEAMLPSIPQSLDWDSLVEMEDNVEGVQTLACTAGTCEI
jgi:ribonucleoside-diphosphate reductase alpha chain